MKIAPAGKKDESVVFTHHGRACTVRRSHCRHQELHDLSAKKRVSILERLCLPLLPRLSLGEII